MYVPVLTEKYQVGTVYIVDNLSLCLLDVAAAVGASALLLKL